MVLQMCSLEDFAPKYVCNSVDVFAESLAATARKAKIDVALAVVYMLAPL
jgi:hypothetical protein